jgi:DNA-binding NarL/FixJ family response regulator
MELPCSLCATVARIPDQQLPRIAGMQKIRVLLAEDHPGVREAIRIQLNLYFEVVGCVDNGESLVESAMELRPDVIVCDIEMPKLNGILAANRLRELNCATKIIFLTVHTDPELVRIALNTGALGCVPKTSIATDLMLAVRAAAQGRTFGPRGTPGVDV